MLLIIDYSFVQTLRPCARERVSVEWEGYTTSSTRYGGSRAIVTCAGMRILAHVIGSYTRGPSVTWRGLKKPFEGLRLVWLVHGSS